VQTLAKTFAQLSIGLAIFDRNRQLVLFNPALVDLTALPADFLSGRPTILSFFDRLRDNKMMPEPKNYNSWREQMGALVEAAASGQYQETWSLSSGSVYSVSGRPHPDGAVAFLFEDITAEITLTRRFRSDLELWQAVFDNLEDAIAVFSMTGVLIFSNSAYQALWGVDPENTFAQTSILDSIRAWQEQSKASPIWGDIRDFVSMQENRAEWWAKVALKSGEQLICSVHPVQRGVTMVSFSRATDAKRAAAENQTELSVD
jgi:PAS domain-containing protein